MLKTIKFKMLVLVAGGLGLGAIGLSWYFNRIYERTSERITRESIRSAAASFAEVERTSIELMGASMEALTRDPELRAGLAARDPARLMLSVEPIFREFRRRYGITHMNFWEPEQAGETNPKGLRNILRVGTPAMHGDFVERETLARVARERKQVAGLDLGFTGMVLRVLMPVEEGGRIIGYAELGKEIGGFLKAIKNVSGDEYGLLLAKGRMDEKKWSTQRAAVGAPNNWGDMPDFLLAQNTTDDDALVQYTGRVSDLPDGGQPLEIVSKGAKTMSKGVFPIRDVAGTKVGAVFVLHDITAVYDEMKSGQLQAIAGVVVLMTLLAALIIVVFQLLVVRRIQHMIKVATRVVGGEFDLQIVPSADDEIGAFETLFEQFRLLFVELIGHAQRATGTSGRERR